MPNIIVPFRSDKQPYQIKELYARIPEPVQEMCQKNSHLVRYLVSLPLGEMGIPEFRNKFSRSDSEIEKKNYIYQVADRVFIHILSASDGDRDSYIPIEPGLGLDLTHVIDNVEERLLNMSGELDDAASNEEKRLAILKCLSKICVVRSGAGIQPANGKVYVTFEQMDTLKYLVLRDKLGLAVLDPLINDPNIEDISCSGVGQVFVEHKIFKSLQSAIAFETHEDLDDFVLRLSEHIRMPVTLRKPIVDATLPDGSRINIVFGREFRGGEVISRSVNFPIRLLAFGIDWIRQYQL